MIELFTTYQRRAARVLALAALVALVACSKDSPVSPDGGDGGEVIDDPTTAVVHLAWDAPTTDADGSGPITDLIGYTVVYGPDSRSLDSAQDVGNVTSVELELPVGTHFVAVRAYDTWRNESDLSNVIQITVGAAS